MCGENEAFFQNGNLAPLISAIDYFSKKSLTVPENSVAIPMEISKLKSHPELFSTEIFKIITVAR
jgi:hypothetical protein